jgi:CHASE2 domain-containing sensor protein
MGKVITFNFGRGDLENGFTSLTAALSAEGQISHRQYVGSLPAAPEIIQLYKRWQLLYKSLLKRLNRSVRMEISDDYISHVSEVDFEQLCQQLARGINVWLKSPEFVNHIELPLSRELNRDDEIQLILQTSDDIVRRLPWHLWDFFDHYPKAEISISTPTFESQIQSQTPPGEVRILAILGNTEGINVAEDRRLLGSLPNVNLCFLESPSRQRLDRYLRDDIGWDIIFFAGHSKTEGQQGIIDLNENQRLNISDLKYALRTAITQGLQLAIFNSCDGLGLALELEELHIPQVIVMREPVADLVAQSFLKHFLAAFASGTSFYLAVRQAREQLQALEDECPCASWLPVTFQNPALLPPPTWQELSGATELPAKVSIRQSLLKILSISLVCTSLVVGVRSLGGFQELELKTFDPIQQLRPNEGLDRRLLLVTITEEDVQNQPAEERGAASLSDRSLDRLLTKLEQSPVKAIGLDIYRDNPVKPKYLDLAARMKKSDRFFAICFYGNPGVPPPPEVPSQQQGFNNILLDSDNVLRRHLLSVESPEPCQSQYSFSLQLAQRYLRGVARPDKFVPKNSSGYIQLGKTVFKTLETDTGGYHNLDDRGHQILINYRASRQIAETVTLTEFLNNYSSQKLENRIVLIGTVAPSFNDHRWQTPLGTMTGLEVQAHLVSQILSTVLDNRPSIWSLPKPLEVIWIGLWSIIGAIIAWQFSGKHKLLLVGGIALMILSASSGILFVFQGCWIPLIPSGLVAILTGLTVTFCRPHKLGAK